MDGAGAGGNQQDPAMIFLQQTGSGNGGQIGDRVECEAGADQILGGHWQYLAQQWIIRVALAHTGDITLRDPQREGATIPAQ